MGNEGWPRVVRMRIVELNFTSGKKVTLVNLLHVPSMNMNLVKRDLSRKPGIKFMYESWNLIFTRNCVFVGNDYFAEGMIKLCTIDNIINKDSISSYMIEYVSLWHSRLSHIDISTMKILIKYGLISCDVNNLKKCEKYVK